MSSQARFEVRTLTQADAAGAIDALVDAFFHDPVAHWVYPDDDDYRSLFPAFISAFAGSAFISGTAYATSGGEGTALWLPPGVHPDEAVLEEVVRALPGDHIEDLMGFVDLQTRIHPAEDHWYLPLLGVRPSKQGTGAGSALLTHALATCDERGLPAYLEATTPASRRLYERHGFEVTGVVQFGSSPEMWPMWRSPR